MSFKMWQNFTEKPFPNFRFVTILSTFDKLLWPETESKKTL